MQGRYAADKCVFSPGCGASPIPFEPRRPEVGSATRNDVRRKLRAAQASGLPGDELAHSWDREGQEAALGGVDQALLDHLVA